MCKRERKGGRRQREEDRRPRGKLIGRRAPGRWQPWRRRCSLSSSAAAKSAAVDEEACRLGRRAWRAIGTAPTGRLSVVAPWQAAGPQAQMMSRAMKRSLVGTRASPNRSAAAAGEAASARRRNRKNQTKHRKSSCYQLRFATDNVISFTSQLFFGTVLCFDEIWQGRETAMPADTLTSRHRRVQGSGSVVPNSRRGRADRRKMGVPDPSRRAQRPSSFRGIPGRAGDRAQHPFRPARQDGRRRDSRALARPGRSAAA